MTVHVTRHAATRARERLAISYKSQRNKLFTKALRYGTPPNEFYGEFCEYLKSKKRHKNSGVKVYDGNVYIYKNKTVITVFSVPQKYRPYKQWLTKNIQPIIESQPVLLKKLYEVVDKDKVELEVIQVDQQGNVVSGLTIDGVFECFGLGQSEVKSKNSAIRTYLSHLGKEINEEDTEKKEGEDMKRIKESTKDSMLDIYECPVCNKPEYYGMLHWHNGHQYCRSCIYSIWEKEEYQAAVKREDEFSAQHGGDPDYDHLSYWKPTEKDYTFPLYSDGIDYTEKEGYYE